MECFVVTKIIFSFNRKLIVYRITGCFNKCVGKTGRTGRTGRNIITRMDEHGTKSDQPMY